AHALMEGLFSLFVRVAPGYGCINNFFYHCRPAALSARRMRFCLLRSPNTLAISAIFVIPPWYNSTARSGLHGSPSPTTTGTEDCVAVPSVITRDSLPAAMAATITAVRPATTRSGGFTLFTR